MEYQDFIKHLEKLNLGVDKTATSLVLNSDLAAELCNSIKENALSLKNDSELLLDKGSKHAASALAILAIEELGKMDLVRQIFMCREDEKELVKKWRGFRDHRSKNVLWTMYFLKKNNATMEDVKKTMNSKSNASQFLNDLKMACFYVDISNDGDITRPSNIIDDVHLETIEIMNMLFKNMSFNFYSKKYFEVLDHFLFVDKQPYSDKIYKVLLEEGVMDEFQYYNIINRRHIL